jgi:hypothetical protein
MVHPQAIFGEATLTFTCYRGFVHGSIYVYIICFASGNLMHKKMQYVSMKAHATTWSKMKSQIKASNPESMSIFFNAFDYYCHS